MYKVMVVSLLFLGLIACRSKNKPTDNKSDTDHISTSVKKNILPASKNYVSTDFPSDTIYPAQLLTTEGIAHQDEVDPNSADHHWKGIFRSDSGYYISDTKITLSKGHDAVLDDDGKKTGWIVTPNIKDTCIILISGLDDLDNRKISKIDLKEQLLPGDKQDFVYNDVKYTLYATGNKKQEAPGSNGFIISDYKLFFKATVNGRSYKQLLVSVENFDDAMTTIIFAGDIDGDNIPDLILNTTNHYNVEAPTLYLSKTARNGDLLNVVGRHTYVGC